MKKQAMTPAERKRCSLKKNSTMKKQALTPAQRKRRSRKRKAASMSASEQNQYLEERRAKRKAQNDQRKKDKQDNPKGYVLNEVDWLLTDDFVKQESNKTIISEAKDRDEKEGYHYLGPMKTICGYCGALGFEAEVQGYFKDKNGKKQCHFGQLCCNQGKVKGISDYNLQETLKRLYTSDDEQSIFFETMHEFVTMLL